MLVKIKRFPLEKLHNRLELTSNYCPVKNGIGKWAGGNGTFSDPNDPNATYTLTENEIGSSVVLTYKAIIGEKICNPLSAEVTISSDARSIIATNGDDQRICGLEYSKTIGGEHFRFFWQNN